MRQINLRAPDYVDDEISKTAHEFGLNKNSTILMMIRWFHKFYNAPINLTEPK